MTDSALPRPRARKSTAGLAVVAVAVLAGTAVTERSRLSASFTVLGHLRWSWLPAAIALESLSMAAFAWMFRWLLAAGHLRHGRASMLATVYAANAVSATVPLAGPELGTAVLFRRFTRHGADGLLAGWALLAGGVITTAAWILILAVGGLTSGHSVATAITVPCALLVVAAVTTAAAAARRPRLRSVLELRGARVLGLVTRLLRRPAADPAATVRAWTDRMGALRLPVSGWALASGAALVNWLADVGVLTVSVIAVGAAVPWRDLLLVYAAGITAKSLAITPGGLAITEGAISVSLVASGVRASQALAIAVLYRLISFWLVAAAGWLILFLLRARKPVRLTTLPALPPADAPATLEDHELVLLHGQPGSAADWQSVIARLPPQLHAVAADRPGYGANARPADGFTANAQAVLDDLDARGVQDAVLVGHSWGGGVALRTANLAPHRVRAVVLLGSVGPGCLTSLDWLLAAPGIGELSSLLAFRWTPPIARAWLAWRRRQHGRPLYPGESASLQVWGYPSESGWPLWRTFLAEQRALRRELDELAAAAASIRVPVLLIADPADRVVPVKTSRRLAAMLPSSSLLLVEGAGHHLPRRAPRAVADAIATFLAAADARPAADADDWEVTQAG
ncbi:MAG TPA: alpha/beta fold hydrolase [Trebonia sp.]|nr:alpha/beta fold hydrolase [Trebonia sp.]